MVAGNDPNMGLTVTKFEISRYVLVDPDQVARLRQAQGCLPAEAGELGVYGWLLQADWKPGDSIPPESQRSRLWLPLAGLMPLEPEPEPARLDVAETLAGLIVHGAILSPWIVCVWLLAKTVQESVPMLIRLFYSILIAGGSIGLVAMLFKLDDKISWPWFSWRFFIIAIVGILVGTLFVLSTYLA